MNKSITVVFILGTGHCGSTLLNLLMNGNSRMLGLSELSKLHECFRETAGENPLESDFWRGVGTRYESRTGQSFSQLRTQHPSWMTMLRWGADRWGERRNVFGNLMLCLAEESGESIMVDASKSWQQLYLLRTLDLFNLKVIHLVRDGRGVTNSYSRKYGKFSPGLNKWLKQSVMALLMSLKFRADQWTRVHYEQLAADPVETLEDICRFVEVPYEEEMMSYRQHDYIGIGGNRMAKKKTEAIRLDEKWRREMSPRHRYWFLFLGGWLNKALGYKLL